MRKPHLLLTCISFLIHRIITYDWIMSLLIKVSIKLYFFLSMPIIPSVLNDFPLLNCSTACEPPHECAHLIIRIGKCVIKL